MSDRCRSFVTKPLGSSATVITTPHDRALVEGESGTG